MSVSGPERTFGELTNTLAVCARHEQSLRMKPLRHCLAIAIAFVALVACEASACRVSSSQASFLYYDVPADLPETAIVLDVVFIGTVQPAAFGQERIDSARIRRVVQGDFESDTVLVHLFVTSCNYGVSPGAQGLIIGQMYDLPDGRRVFSAMQESIGARSRRGGRFE